MQAELKNLREAVIPKTNKDIKILTVDLAATNGKLNHINRRFDDIFRRKEENAESQTSRFNKLDLGFHEQRHGNVVDNKKKPCPHAEKT